MPAKVKPNTQIIGQNLVYFPRLDSTNSLAMELFKNNMAENGTVIYTDQQTKGRGQMQKEWISHPFENIMFSIILKPVTNIIANPFLLNKCITLAVFNFISEKLNNEIVRIKWPNDIMVNRKKIAGILVENSYSGQQLNVSIVGIGVNVNQAFEGNEAINATSISEQLKEVSDRSLLLEKLLETIDWYYIKLINGETELITVDYDLNLLGFGEENDFIFENKTIKAKITGCDNEGHLLLINKNKVIDKYMHGEIKQVIKK